MPLAPLSRALDRLPRRLVLLLLAATSACGGGGDGPIEPPPAVSVSVSPSSTTVDAGGSATFTATVSNATSSAVTWTASGGTIAGNGATATWTAPVSGGPFTITATSTADPTRAGTATVTVRSVSVAVSPATLTVASGETRSFTATVANSANTNVTWTASAGTIVGSATGASVMWTAPVGGGTATLTATSAADPTQTGVATVTVTPVVVTVAPSAPATVPAGGTQTFTASVTGGADSAVVWTASAGTIAPSGGGIVWTAPAVGGSYTVTATSTLDPAVRTIVPVTVSPVVVSVTPSAVSAFRGEPVSVAASVTGAALGLDGVSWTSTCGAITPAGAQVSLSAPSAAGSCTVTATSALDPASTSAATLTTRAEWLVTSTDDVSDGACTFAHCSLREAITAANAAPDADVILLGTLSASAPVTASRQTAAQPTAALTAPPFALPATIRLTSALPSIQTPMQIVGPGATLVILDADAALPAAPRRVLTVTGTGADPVRIRGLTLSGGRQTMGGGLLVEAGARVTLEQVTLSANTSFDGPGGGAVVFGGSTLTVVSSLVEGNRAGGTLGSGGGLAAGGQSVLLVQGGVLRNNMALTSFGGGVTSSDATVTLEDVVVENNHSADAGGGVSIWDKGSLTITGGTLRNNTSDFVGGGMIAGAPSLATTSRVTVSLENVRIAGNSTLLQGGGVQLTRNVEANFTNVTVADNRTTGAPTAGSPTLGAGVFGGEKVMLTMDRSTVAGNQMLAASSLTLEDGGGGIMFTASQSGSSVLVTNSTISGNSSTIRGGGVFMVNQSRATLVNTTISGNSAPIGGGVLVGGATLLRNVTLVGNTASVRAAGLGVAPGFTAQVENAIFANNLVNVGGSNCATEGNGTIATLGHNLSDDATCSAFLNIADQRNVPAGLSLTLADNGGPTRTHALLAGSTAINAGNSATCSATDQRGVAREGICDQAARRGPPRRIPDRLATPTGLGSRAGGSGR